MFDKVLLSPIPLEELKNEISLSIKTEIERLLLQRQPANPLTDYLTRKQAGKILGVSLPTIDHWTKTGMIKGYRVGSRVRYKRPELAGALTAIKTQSNLHD